MTMIISMHDSLRKLRGQYEDAYENQILNPDIIETLVEEFSQSGIWLKNSTLDDVMAEAEILKKTLTFSSNYNRNES